MTTLDSDFRFLQQFVFDRSAIVLADEKEYLVEARLRPVAQRAGVDSVAELLSAVRRGNASLETQIVDAMTTNETSWFRDRSPFDALRKIVLPEVIARNAARRRLRIWSAACSTGQEIYSIAMILDAEVPELAGWTVDLYATDLSTEVLDKAREAKFSASEINRGLPASHVVRYFRRESAYFRLSEEIRERVRFDRFNLAKPWPPVQDFDVIFLRNVLIYFDVSTKQQVLTAARNHLRPGGFLLLGSAETTRGLVEGFAPVQAAGTAVYRLEEA